MLNNTVFKYAQTPTKNFEKIKNVLKTEKIREMDRFSLIFFNLTKN